MAAERKGFMNPSEQAPVPYITTKLAGAEGPIVATTDYMSMVPDQIRQYIPNRFATLGADDFGFADTRAAARRHFAIDSHSMVVRALQMLEQEDKVEKGTAVKAFEKYRIDDPRAGTTGNAGGDA